jgi:hypothetical protein
MRKSVTRVRVEIDGLTFLLCVVYFEKLAC